MQIEHRDLHEENASDVISVNCDIGRNVTSERCLHPLKHLRSIALIDEDTENEVMERSCFPKLSSVAAGLSGMEDEDPDIR
jgi:hypothetical protein